VVPTVVSDDGERLPLHEYCRAEWFNQTRGRMTRQTDESGQCDLCGMPDQMLKFKETER
jgi:hypothetical protein